MPELTWRKAIIKVFEDEKKALHYTEIAELIADKGYRLNFGATPQDTVSAQMTTDINKNGENSTFAKVDRGIYILRKFLNNDVQISQSSHNKTDKEQQDKLKIINSFGIYWDRKTVHWESSIPNLYAIQQKGAEPIDFKNQIGIYLLHDSRETIYIGQAIKQTLSKRLRDHTSDRLSGRWNRFSWFGFYAINSKGNLNTDIELNDITIENIGDLLEAILIESIEPRQNRKQGNLFNGIEYLQHEAPELKEKKMKQTIQALTEKFYK